MSQDIVKAMDDLYANVSFKNKGKASRTCRTVTTGITTALGGRFGGTRGAIAGSVVGDYLSDYLCDPREVQDGGRWSRASDVYNRGGRAAGGQR